MDVQSLASLDGKKCPNCGGRLEYRETRTNGGLVFAGYRVVCVRSGKTPNECRPYRG